MSPLIASPVSPPRPPLPPAAPHARNPIHILSAKAFGIDTMIGEARRATTATNTPTFSSCEFFIVILLKQYTLCDYLGFLIDICGYKTKYKKWLLAVSFVYHFILDRSIVLGGHQFCLFNWDRLVFNHLPQQFQLSVSSIIRLEFINRYKSTQSYLWVGRRLVIHKPVLDKNEK